MVSLYCAEPCHTAPHFRALYHIVPCLTVPMCITWPHNCLTQFWPMLEIACLKEEWSLSITALSHHTHLSLCGRDWSLRLHGCIDITAWPPPYHSTPPVLVHFGVLIGVSDGIVKFEGTQKLLKEASTPDDIVRGKEVKEMLNMKHDLLSNASNIMLAAYIDWAASRLEHSN